MIRSMLVPFLLLLLVNHVIAEDRKLSVPSGADQLAALRTIKDVHKAEFAKRKQADRIALAEALLKEATETKDDPVARFVLYKQASYVAVEAGRMELANRILDELVQLYEVDLLETRCGLLTLAAQGNPLVHASLSDAYIQAATEAIAADRLDLASQTVSEATEWARKARQTNAILRMEALAKEIKTIQAEHDGIKAALKKIKEGTAAPADRRAVGRYFGLVKGNWDEAIPLLAESDDDTLKQLAKSDQQAASADSAGQLAVADQWWELAQAEKDGARRNLRRRAHHWYEEVSTQLTGINLTRVENHLREIERANPSLYQSRPVHQWTFEIDGRDSVGGMHGQLQGKASIARGRLRLLDGTSVFNTVPLKADLKERTLEVWVVLANLSDQAYVMCIKDLPKEEHHDGIMLGSIQSRKWYNQSSYHHRTPEFGGPDENAKPGEVIHIAITYKTDGSLTCYRNGKRYGQPSGANPPLVAYLAREANVRIGDRFAGEVLEARIYNRPLTAKEIAVSFRVGPVGSVGSK